MVNPESQTGFKKYEQKNRNDSPWSIRERVGMVAWDFCWALFCTWTPKPFNAWRVTWLKVFGARIYGRPFVHQRARIAVPWNIILHDGSCIGDRVNLYSLAEIEVGASAVVAQEAYLCTGTHDFNKKNFSLITSKIFVGEEAFIGARAFILPGVTIGRRTVVGACAVVTRSVPDRITVVGNPAGPRKE